MENATLLVTDLAGWLRRLQVLRTEDDRGFPGLVAIALDPSTADSVLLSLSPMLVSQEGGGRVPFLQSGNEFP